MLYKEGEHMENQVRDLRSALKLLKEIPGQLVETDVEVNPKAELAGVYRYVGAGGTVKRPTKEGPAMIFNNIKDRSKYCIKHTRRNSHIENLST